MGYADTTPYQQVTIKAPLEAGMIVIDSLALGNYDLCTLTIPNFKRPLSLAYLDLIIQYCSNDHAAANYLINAGSFGLLDSGLTFRASANVAGNTLFTHGGEHWNAPYVLTGATDLHQYIVPGGTHDVQFNQIRCNAGNLYILAYYAELRCYFAI